MTASETILAGLDKAGRIAAIEGQIEACRTAEMNCLLRGWHATALEVEAARKSWQARLYILKGGRVA